ncbi:unnamed protein product [Prunus armeniaca]
MIEHPKKEIPVKMPGNDKHLATIIEGRPTFELTRTQKRRVQRQYCTFLKNKDNTQVLPEVSSARKGKNLEADSQAKQTTYQPEELTKTEVPSKPTIHPTSPLINQLEPSQSQGQSGLILVEGQEGWIEEYEEEQLDYEPSADDQTGLPEIGEQEDWTKEYGEKNKWSMIEN